MRRRGRRLLPMYIYAAILIAGLLGGFGAAWKVQAWRHDSAALAAQEQARETEKMRRQAANSAATKHEADKVRIVEKFVPITQEVDRVVTQIEYRDRACFTDDGLRLVNEAVRATGDPAVPGNPLSAASAPR